MHHSTKKYISRYVTCQQFKAAVVCSLSSLGHGSDMYLHGSTSIGGHFAAIKPQHLVNLPDREFPSVFFPFSLFIPEIMELFLLYFYPILLHVHPELIGRIRVHGHAFNSDNLNFPCLVPHGACLLHHYCRAGHFSAGLLLASLVWSTFEPRYRITCPRLVIYGSFSLIMVKSASIARGFDETRKLDCEFNLGLQLWPYSLMPTECSRVAVRIVAQIWLQTRSDREGRNLMSKTWDSLPWLWE